MNSSHTQSAKPLNLVQTISTSDVTWQAIVSRLSTAQQPLASWHDTGSPASATSPVEESSVPIFQINATSPYLDAQERYQLLEPITAPSETFADVEARVLDRFPFEPSQLETLVDNQLEYADPSVAASPEPPQLVSRHTFHALPAIAQTYLTLQHQLYPSLPQIHDAWEQNGHVIILLEDRAALPLLTDTLHHERVWPIQIVHWFYEMTDLWSALKRYQCCQSLLQPTNLRIDEDQILCLKRLYIDSHDVNSYDASIRLSDLGRIWQTVLHHSPQLQSEPISQLAHRVETGEIDSLDDVRLQLEALADQLQIDDSMTSPHDSNWLQSGGVDNSNDDDDDIDDMDSENTIPMDEPFLTLSFDESAMTEPKPPRISDPSDNDIPLEMDDVLPTYGEYDDDDGDGIAGDGDDVPTVVLPMQLFNLADSGRTDIGRQRDHNEDCFSIQTDIRKIENPTGRILGAKGLYILCDGMGGHEGGEVASALAVDTLKQYFAANWSNRLPSEASIRTGIVLANQKIYELNQTNACHGSGRMGTTLVMVLIHDTKVAIAHVGDSRIYQYTRKRGLEQLTLDHEVGQREILRGVEPGVAYARPDAYQLTQALGPRDDSFINPDIQFFDVSEDILFALCSDGLTDNELLEAHVMSHLDPLLSSQASLDEGVNQLIDLANEHNGHDNITVVLVRVKLRPYIESLRQNL